MSEYYTIYRGRFADREGRSWRVDIQRLQDSAPSAIGELTFPGSDAITIEWPQKGWDKALWGSQAVVTIESPGDRTYVDLYTSKPGEIRLLLFMNGVIYWYGTLDTEFYEEPYNRVADYDVSLTFSDFAKLDRTPYDQKGRKSIEDLLYGALQASEMPGIPKPPLLTGAVTTTVGEANVLEAVAVDSDNFYDEDGEPLTWAEVIDGILVPLGLHLRQLGGSILLCDHNGIAASTGSPVAWWDARTLGVSEVYNNINITWSPYVRKGNLAPEKCFLPKTDDSHVSGSILTVLPTIGSSGCMIFTYRTETNHTKWAQDPTDNGFTLWISENGKNATLVDQDIRFFKIVPHFDGQESEGIAIAWHAWGGWVADYAYPLIRSAHYGHDIPALKGGWSQASGTLWKSASISLGSSPDSSCRLRITLPLLLDPRFNPFESASETIMAEGMRSQKTVQEQWNARGNFFYIPVRVRYKDAASGKIYSWSNSSIVSAYPGSTRHRSFSATLGNWAEDNTGNRVGYFAWYDGSDREEKAGVANGWADNRQAINPHSVAVEVEMEHNGKGQMLPMPPIGINGGELWIEVCAKGWIICDHDSNDANFDSYGLWDGEFSASYLPEPLPCAISWILMQLPQVEMVKPNGDELDDEDVEYSAVADANAAEPIDLSTICGTSDPLVPGARGAYLNASTGQPVTEFTRAGRTTQAENLLIGTIYSQHATRHTRLSGEAEMSTLNALAWTDDHQDGKKFIVTKETQHLLESTRELTLTEISPDCYNER